MRRALIWLIVLAAAAVAVWFTQIREVDARVKVYFVGQADGATTVVEVERTVRGRGAASLLRAAMEALLAGPTGAERARGLTTEIPAGTRLRGIAVNDGIASVDVTEAVASGGGSTSMRARLWQIVYTATQFPAAQQARLLIEGQERQALGGEGVLIDKPISRPAAFPRF